MCLKLKDISDQLSKYKFASFIDEVILIQRLHVKNLKICFFLKGKLECKTKYRLNGSIMRILNDGNRFMIYNSVHKKLWQSEDECRGFVSKTEREAWWRHQASISVWICLEWGWNKNIDYCFHVLYNKQRFKLYQIIYFWKE